MFVLINIQFFSNLTILQTNTSETDCPIFTRCAMLVLGKSKIHSYFFCYSLVLGLLKFLYFS
ncbi:hypothetical protein CW304_29805 [Bacillus sp. UFRGS-B20]|nr:hypothetical protein CW304_29805 [Bacillus sp. UFRGS-B20]